jgi:hypothetical protein
MTYLVVCSYYLKLSPAFKEATYERRNIVMVLTA